MRFIAKMGGLIVYYPNKYIMISIYSTDLTKARHPQSWQLQNIEDLLMHYTIGHSTDYGHYSLTDIEQVGLKTIGNSPRSPAHNNSP